MNKLSDQTILLLILLAAFILRLIGIRYGLPSFFNSDEPFNVINALAFGAKKSLEPTYYVYPTFFSYLLFAVYGLFFIIGKLFGAFQSAVDFGSSYFLNPTGLFLVGRLVSVLFGTATVFLVYKIAISNFSKRIAIFATVILTLSFVHADISHWILLEPALAFMSALSIFLILKFYDSPSLRSNVVASLICGLAISTKYNSGFLIIPLIITLYFLFKNDAAALIKNLTASIAAIVAGFLIGSPYWIFETSKFIEQLRYTFSHVDAGMVGHIGQIPLLWPLWELIANDWTIGVLLVAGFIYLFFQREKKQVLLGSYCLATLLFVGLWNRSGVHYLIPIFPALAILAAIFLNDVLKEGLNSSLKFTVILLLFLPPLVKIFYNDVRLTQPDTRAYAKQWIESNIPDDSMIAYENYVYGPNLFDPSRFFKNEENAILPLELKEKLLEERLRRVSYRLINLRKDFKLKVLAENPISKDNSSNLYYRQLLEMRLPKLASVRKSKIPYILTSSDNYARYFESVPPKKGTPLRISYQNGRRFYQSIFESKELKLLKEFKPTFWNLGPTIKIYQF